MPTSDRKKTKSAVGRKAAGSTQGEHASQASAAAELQAALQRIASQMSEADRRHSKVLGDVQERLGHVGRQVDQARSAAPEAHAGALGRMEQEIATLARRLAAFGQERQSQRDAAAADEPWDAQSAEALTRACEMAEAELSANRRQESQPKRQERPKRPTPAAQRASTTDRDWVEERLAGIAAGLQKSLVENNPAKSLAVLAGRLDQLEARLETLLGDVAARFGDEWLKPVEQQIGELSAHFDAVSRQLERLDDIDGQLRQLSRAIEEQRTPAKPEGLREDAVEAMIQSAAERAASRMAATLPAPTPDAEAGKRMDALEGMMQDYIAERRRGEEATSGMLHTIEDALIRIIDRVDTLEGPGLGAPADDNASEAYGIDVEGERLAEAYAAGASVLGHRPADRALDAADYAPSPARREGGTFVQSPLAGHADQPAAAEAEQARQELKASIMRAKLKAQSAPHDALEEPTLAPTLEIAPEDGARAARSGGRAPRSGGSLRSRLLMSGAIALLFGTGYLAVDLFVMRSPSAGMQQSDAAKSDGARGNPAEQQPSRTGAARAGSDKRIDQVPVPQPARRNAPEAAGEAGQKPVEQGRATRQLVGFQVPGAASPRVSPAEPAAIPPAEAPALPQDEIAHGDGASPPGLDSLPVAIGSAAMRNAALKGDVFAQFDVATRFAEGTGVPQDHKQAVAWYERAAMRGLASAQFRLGAYYERGVGVDTDLERAKVWYRRAADQGHVKAMHNLGVLVAGRGDEQGDYAGAVHWFQEAARRGYIDSQFNLATLYAAGRGVPKDLTESYKWFALAARAGDVGAARRLEEIKAQLDQPEQEAAERKLATWRADAGEPAASQAAR